MGTPGKRILLPSGNRGIIAGKQKLFDASGAGCDCCGHPCTPLHDENYSDDFSTQDPGWTLSAWQITGGVIKQSNVAFAGENRAYRDASINFNTNSTIVLSAELIKLWASTTGGAISAIKVAIGSGNVWFGLDNTGSVVSTVGDYVYGINELGVPRTGSSSVSGLHNNEVFTLTIDASDPTSFDVTMETDAHGTIFTDSFDPGPDQSAVCNFEIGVTLAPDSVSNAIKEVEWDEFDFATS